jgi:hypothetical protein
MLEQEDLTYTKKLAKGISYQKGENNEKISLEDKKI